MKAILGWIGSNWFKLVIASVIVYTAINAAGYMQNGRYEHKMTEYWGMVMVDTRTGDYTYGYAGKGRQEIRRPFYDRD